jgi:hypothetical protein
MGRVMPRANWFLAAALAALVLACGPGCGERRPQVEGLITLDGVPIEQGAVQFIPANGLGQTAGTGIVAGRYQMPASTGTMRVVINWPQVSGKMLDPTGSGKMVDRYVESVPERYNEKTELEFTVKPGRNVADFPLEGSVLMSPNGSQK